MRGFSDALTAPEHAEPALPGHIERHRSAARVTAAMLRVSGAQRHLHPGPPSLHAPKSVHVCLGQLFHSPASPAYLSRSPVRRRSMPASFLGPSTRLEPCPQFPRKLLHMWAPSDGAGSRGSRLTPESDPPPPPLAPSKRTWTSDRAVVCADTHSPRLFPPLGPRDYDRDTRG